ncbi:ribonuclease HII [Clostridium minihomine]|uniref:ribonuclease HII n=1 Tax=Clostridium minihomine TaxID=2045012 RepID=UPI000C769ACC|nr:ribonuclease HII [Clostridium minihomine]
MTDWYAWEKQAWQQGFQAVCGIDEAGRGPLAGPVFAAAVILPKDCEIEGLNDSKKLSEKKREFLFDQIKECALSYSIAFSTEQEIDEINILQATFLAMNRAAAGLSIPADCALVDGNRDPLLPIPTTLVVKGDSQSANIAAASILAKVSRDRLMLELDELYPQYQFRKHKGYGTALHRELLLQHGPCPIHRKSFLKKILGEKSVG